jgi:hypothetical protein
MKHSRITVRGLDALLAEKIQQLAAEEGISLNKAALRLLRRGAGLPERDTRPRIGSSLDAFIGTWSEEEATELLESIRSCNQVDPEFWR